MCVGEGMVRALPQAGSFFKRPNVTKVCKEICDTACAAILIFAVVA